METQTISKHELLEDIEVARKELIATIENYGINHVKVLETSEKLDRLINIFQFGGHRHASNFVDKKRFGASRTSFRYIRLEKFKCYCNVSSV